ncbi:MAG: hypothetical protein HWN68_15795 [Desulfobacterales bacterium]|nr:hypothetical protein [Desulfobacterales bacterium]
MGKLNPKISGRGPISKKVLSGLRKSISKKVIDLSELKNAKIHAESLEKTVISEKELSRFDPLHGVYVYAQNKISILVEQLGELPALSKLTNAYADAQDLYMPSGPPMSPLTTSYFSCWGFFDLCAGIKRESFGTVTIDLCRSLNVDQGLIKIFECMQNSRMGFFVHEGISEGYVLLRELITQKQIRVIVPSGYLGESGEIWFARIMPEPFPELNYGYSVVFTTPYIISEMKNDKFIFSSEKNCILFFERNLEKTKIKEKKCAYEFLMKYGLNRCYWNEYIFEGYVNYKHEMIILAGFPDIPLSKPHSKESQERMGA